ncbi:oxidoreductase [Pseudomonas kuykendallii]|uniref:oxidoreductase n=1 Tax=Pseudomonas kuykendallii TaxID=1007099 RepID=UPI0028D61B73|nr:oxidoreductase [Pseudomonas kuykendallii]
MHDSDSKLFFISGVSSGFGRAFAEAALAAGHRVVGSLRSAADLQAFEQDPSGRAFGVLLDVTDDAAIDAAIAGVERDHGPIEVLVNNAGYGHEGILEESPLAELRHQFDVNLFGAVALIKAVLPGMRQRRSGRIINITSMGGFITLPGIAYYCGSKFALEGISETLASEVRDFGIFVTAVAPGSFRTDWAGRSMRRSERSIADYDALFEPIRAARESKSGRQNGDPRKAAQVLLQLVAMESPPTHLLLGSDALQLVQAKLAALQDEIARYAELSRSTDF